LAGWCVATPRVGGAMAEDQGTGHKLFVGCLPEDTTNQELKLVFNAYGEVNHVHVMSPHSRTGQRCACIFYDSPEAAEDAIKALDGVYKIREDAETPIQVRWSKEPPESGAGKKGGNMLEDDNGGRDSGRETGRDEGHKLFVGRLPGDVTEDELRMVFGTYGEVNTVHITRPNVSGLKGAFVFYRKFEAAEDAIKVLDGQYKIREEAPEPIQVRWGRPDSKASGSKGGGRGNQDFGRGGPYGYDGGGWYGGKDGKGKGSPPMGPPGWPMPPDRYGWDGFRGGRGDPYYGRGDPYHGRGDPYYGRADPYYGRGDPYYGRDPHWDDRRGGGRPPAGGDRREASDIKLYVSNLPEDIDERAIDYVFKTYGRVVKIHIMTGKKVNDRISAFVEYATTRDADTAIAALHDNYEIRPGFGPLTVKHAMPPKPKPYGGNELPGHRHW